MLRFTIKIPAVLQEQVNDATIKRQHITGRSEVVALDFVWPQKNDVHVQNSWHACQPSAAGGSPAIVSSSCDAGHLFRLPYSASSQMFPRRLNCVQQRCLIKVFRLLLTIFAASVPSPSPCPAGAVSIIMCLTLSVVDAENPCWSRLFLINITR